MCYQIVLGGLLRSAHLKDWSKHGLRRMCQGSWTRCQSYPITFMNAALIFLLVGFVGPVYQLRSYSFSLLWFGIRLVLWATYFCKDGYLSAGIARCCGLQTCHQDSPCCCAASCWFSWWLTWWCGGAVARFGAGMLVGLCGLASGVLVSLSYLVGCHTSNHSSLVACSASACVGDPLRLDGKARLD